MYREKATRGPQYPLRYTSLRQSKQLATLKAAPVGGLFRGPRDHPIIAGKAPAADHVKVSRSAMVLLAGSQLLPAESRHGPSRGAGVISAIAASSRNFTPSRVAGCFF
jgi:hypothetical protein